MKNWVERYFASKIWTKTVLPMIVLCCFFGLLVEVVAVKHFKEDGDAGIRQRIRYLVEPISILKSYRVDLETQQTFIQQLVSDPEVEWMIILEEKSQKIVQATHTDWIGRKWADWSGADKRLLEELFSRAMPIGDFEMIPNGKLQFAQRLPSNEILAVQIQYEKIIESELEGLLTIGFVIVLAIAGVSLFVHYIVTFMVLKPVRTIQDTIESRKHNGAKGFVPDLVKDELGEVALALNELLRANDNSEEKLKTSKMAAEDLARIKSEFLATMSHEIRTPLNGIIGMTQLLADSPMNPAQAEGFHVIRQSGLTLMTLVNDILDYSKMEAGKLVLEKVDFDMLSVMEEVSEILAAKAEEKHLDLILDLPLFTSGWVIGDPNRFRQIILNLVSNAVKFTTEGTVILGAMPLQGQSGWEFWVEDTGIGMSEKQCRGLFQPFSQADSSTTRKFGGTGLGLAIVKRLVEVMDGRLEVYSQSSVGSRFTLRIPFAASKNAPDWIGLPIADEIGGCCIHVKSEAVRQQLQKMMLQCQVQVSNRTLTRFEMDDMGVKQSQTSGRSEGGKWICICDRVESHAGNPDAPDSSATGQAQTLFQVRISNQSDTLRAQGDDAANESYVLRKPIGRRLEFLKMMEAVRNVQQRISLSTQSSLFPAEWVGVSVLVVEDNAINQKIAVRCLEKMGCTVTLAENGAEAVKACEGNEFDLVLMDCQMPVMDRFEATRRIRMSVVGGGSLPILALSAGVTREEQQECFEAGMDDFIGKPIQASELKSALRKWLKPKVSAKG